MAEPRQRIPAFIAGFQGVDPSLFDACAIDGVRNRFQELWYVTLPSMKSQMLFSAVMQIVSAFTVADISVQLVGFPSTEYAGETLVIPHHGLRQHPL